MSPALEPLTIVTSVSGGYAAYLGAWAASIVAQGVRPHAAAIASHGPGQAQELAAQAARAIEAAGIPVRHVHSAETLDLGRARNIAVGLSATEWVMHLDADDELLPHALEDVAALQPAADIVALGYRRSGDLAAGPANRERRYRDIRGPQLLQVSAPCSGVSPFRRSLWERSPYREDMLGAWDTALWIGFARLGDVRVKATARPAFLYRQHADSVFNTRRTTLSWARRHTEAMLARLRRNAHGVTVLVPHSRGMDPSRTRAWRYAQEWWRREFPEWQLVIGRNPPGRWCKGAAVQVGLNVATGATLVIADADCLVGPAALREAVTRVEAGAPWAVPHGPVVRYGPQLTAQVLERTQDPFAVAYRREDLDRAPYEGFAGGGILVVPRWAYEAVGGFPLRFQGWGSEDQALAVILDALVGRHWRGQAPLIHLHHEPQDRSERRRENLHALRDVRRAALEGRDALVRHLAGRARSGPADWQRRALEVARRRTG